MVSESELIALGYRWHRVEQGTRPRLGGSGRSGTWWMQPESGSQPVSMSRSWMKDASSR